MKIFFTTHAKSRLVEREVTLTEIHQIIKNPDYTKPSFKDTVLMGKKFGSSIIEIVCTKRIDKIIIITVYYL